MEKIMIFINESKNLSELSRKVYGTSDTKHRELTKKLLLEYNIDYQCWTQEKRNQTRKFCIHCGKEIKGRDRGRKKFCCHSCAATYNNLARTNDTMAKFQHCLFCGAEIVGSNKFCSNDCKQNYEYDTYIKEWKDGKKNGIVGRDGLSKYIRTYLFLKNNSKCEKCGWGEVNTYTSKVPLQVHHIDGNCLNNNEENLQLLCPNCHSLTENYGNRDGHKSQRLDKRLKYVQQSFQDETIAHCIQCGNPLNAHQTMFCSHKCHVAFERKKITKDDILNLYNHKDNHNHSNAFVARQLNMSTTTLRKKIKTLGILDDIEQIIKE